jgi:predicted nucleic acid-binding protein
VIAADTSSLVAYFEGAPGADVEAIARAVDSRQLVLPPVVLTELLSDPALPRPVRRALAGLPILDVVDGYWVRAGSLRASILRRGRKARVADALIAQSCLDHGLALITRDRDFRHVVAGLGLLLVGR